MAYMALTRRALVCALVAFVVLGVAYAAEPKADINNDDDEPMSIGSIAYPGQFPWHVAVLKVGAGEHEYFDIADLLGSGALISTGYVLTAASALQDDWSKLSNVSVLLGALDAFNIGKLGTRIDSQSLVRHEKWNSTTAENDVALVQLSSPAVIGERIDLIRLPPRYYEEASYVGRTLSVTSWGVCDVTNVHAQISVYNVDVIRNVDCQAAQTDPAQKLPWTKMCALSPQYSTIPGTRDKGGAVVFLEKDNKYTLVGVVSSDVQGSGSKPSTIARITEQLDWIAQNSDVPA